MSRNSKNMSETERRLTILKDSLPKQKKTDLFNFITQIVTLISFSLLFINFDKFNLNKDNSTIILITFCFILIFILSIFLAIKFFSKRHLYSEVVSHVNYINYACKSFVKESSSYDEESFNVFLSTVTGVISESFSITSRRRCGASIKTMYKKGNINYIRVRMEDPILRNSRAEIDEADYNINEYTSMSAIVEKNSRFYLCN